MITPRAAASSHVPSAAASTRVAARRPRAAWTPASSAAAEVARARGDAASDLAREEHRARGHDLAPVDEARTRVAPAVVRD